MKYFAKQPDKNGFIHFTHEENLTWQLLMERQLKVVEQRACDEFVLGLKKLNFRKDRVPQCVEVSEILKAETGWSVVPVPALIPLSQFFNLLANRQFPAASFIRVREELDYLQEPDIFHELFGHCPMLTHQGYADFIQWYGDAALHTDKKIQSILGRLFWFTIEFGLLQTPDGMRIYGGGILSSFSETLYALESHEPQRKPFNLLHVLNKSYRYDVIQDCYFYLNNLDELFRLKSNTIIEIAERIAKGEFNPTDFVTC
jgi:phenylalanine-4-hydroxylase